MGRRATRNEQIGKCCQHVFMLELASDDQRQAFPARLIDDRQDAELAAIVRSPFHKVVGPDMPRIFRAQPDARPVVQPESAPLGLLLRHL